MVALVNRKSPVTILAHSAVAVSHTGNTTETTLATITIPAGEMGLNGAVEIEALFSFTANANTKTPRFKFGAATVANPAITGGYASSMVRKLVSNRGAANSQITSGSDSQNEFSTGLTAATTSAVDTSAVVTLTITGQLAVGTDTITLERYMVRLYR